MNRTDRKDPRILLALVVASAAATLLAGYLVRDWWLLVIVPAAMIGWIVPRTISVASALWAGMILGLGVTCAIALYRIVYAA